MSNAGIFEPRKKKNRQSAMGMFFENSLSFLSTYKVLFYWIAWFAFVLAVLNFLFPASNEKLTETYVGNFSAEIKSNHEVQILGNNELEITYGSEESYNWPIGFEPQCLLSDGCKISVEVFEQTTIPAQDFNYTLVNITSDSDAKTEVYKNDYQLQLEKTARIFVLVFAFGLFCIFPPVYKYTDLFSFLK